MIVTFTIDDERAARILLTDARWQTVTLTLPPTATRTFRRIDMRTSVARQEVHGVMMGEVALVPRP